MEPEELTIREEDMRALIARLVASGAPHTTETLTEWYLGIVIRRVAGEEVS